MKADEELATERLVLRQFRNEDTEAYAALCADIEVMKYLGGPLTLPDAWRQMALFRGHWSLLGYGLYAVEERSSGAFVGRVGYLNPPAWPGFEVGWTLAREHWGKGYATEAARAAIEHAFTAMGVHEVISLIAPPNTASVRVSERLGQVVRGNTTVKDTAVNIHSITKSEWRAQAPQ